MGLALPLYLLSQKSHQAPATVDVTAALTSPDTIQPRPGTKFKTSATTPSVTLTPA